MASLARTATRLSARRLIIKGRYQQHQLAASFRTSAAALAAQNFTMPALSPTMTQGNIAKWKVKEGDSFSAGDVLLEIETDKASMDVEAQDDGVLVKITQSDGAQNIQVGSRIGVLAEPGDDIASLEIPAEEQPSASSAAAGATPPTKQEQQQSAAAPEKKSERETPKKSSGQKKNPPQKYPLYPSVEHLVKEHGLDEAAILSITPTGPQGRLLKGDVLAYLGAISVGRPAEIKARFEHNAHLDLSGVKIAAPRAPAAEKEKEKEKKPAAAREELSSVSVSVSVSLPVSLAAAAEVQKKVEAVLGAAPPLSTLIARAVDAANDALPLPAGYRPSADELFGQVLGLAKARSSSRGHYSPRIAAPSPSLAGVAPAPKPRQKELDIIDFLAGGGASKKKEKEKEKKVSRSAVAPPNGVATAGPSSFILTVPRAEERRAKAFLQRVKVVLENDPGRLVL